MEKQLGGFLSQPGLILGCDSNCSGGREKRKGCVKELQSRINPSFPGITYQKFGDFSTQARSSFPPFKLLVFQAFKAMATTVAGSHWPSGTTDLNGQLTERSEELQFVKGTNLSTKYFDSKSYAPPNSIRAILR